MKPQALMEKMKTQLSKVKDWSENNKSLVVGAAAGVGVGALIGLIALASRKGKAAGRAGRGKREARLERRALEADARGEFDLDFDADFDAEEFFEFLENLSPDEFDLGFEE
jgi:NADPH-dependent curcumin reductase CurA